MKQNIEIEYHGKRISDGGPQPVTIIERINGVAYRSYSLPHKIVWHSPDGFQWGYGGSGPADLALNLLLHATGDEDTARALHQPFKWAFVASWGDEWTLTRADILEWIERRAAAVLTTAAEGGAA